MTNLVYFGEEKSRDHHLKSTSTSRNVAFGNYPISCSTSDISSLIMSSSGTKPALAI